MLTALYRRLAYLGLPAVLSLLTVAAWADGPAPTGPQPRAAVFAFNDLGAYRGHALGQRAAARVQTELRNTGRFALIARADVRRECAALDLRPPFAVGNQQQVMARVGADVAVTGVVQNCALDAHNATANVTLIGELTEAIGGEQIAVVKAVGAAHAEHKSPVPADELVEEALAAAGKQLAQSLTAGPLITGKVVAHIAGDERVTLEADAPGSFVAGMRALIFRRKDDGGWELGAVASIESVQKPRATGKLLSAKGQLKEGDVAVGVFGGGR